MDNPQPSPPASSSLLGLGVAWTRVGFGALALSVAACVLCFTVHPFLPALPDKVVPEGYRLLAGKGGGLLINSSPLGVLTVFLLVFSALASLAWTLVDIVDRRKRFVWLLPLFVCPLVQALHALPLALYLFYGRETSDPAQGVN